MPTAWNRTAEEFHKIYIANTDAFYRLGDNKAAREMDEFFTSCALQLWNRSEGVTGAHVELANEIYSRGQEKPKWLLWSLTESVCRSEQFLPPVFFWELAERDAKCATEISRTFIRMFTNILLYLASADDELSFAEAEYITECADKLTAICDTNAVASAKPAIDPMDYVTSSAPSFKDRVKPIAHSEGTEEKAQPEKAESEKKDFDALMAELEALVGLEDVKKDVKNLINLVKVRKLREKNALPVPPLSLHMVFLGNPGTGKTTVARLISSLYASIGVLSKGQLVEVDRGGLVAGYVGQTALKTKDAVKSALGGVLFIDEAYSLSSGGENDFGREAIETILKAMEDNREDLIVIAAGYSGPMKDFISSNPGLESRFNKYFFFSDYTGPQLMEIFKAQCKKNDYILSEEAERAAQDLFEKLYEDRGENFGNGRDVRNVFEDAVVRQSNRLAAMDAPTRQELMSLLPEDIAENQDTEDNTDAL